MSRHDEPPGGMLDLTLFSPGETLRYVCSETGYSVYRDAAGDEVYLQDGTGRRLRTLDDLDLRAVGEEWVDEHASGVTGLDFHDWLKLRVTEPDGVDDLVGRCPRCATVEWSDDLYYTNEDHGRVCESCLDDFYGCIRCDDRFLRVDMFDVDGELICEGCRDDLYWWCEGCENYWRNDSGHSCDSDCGCESPAQVFSIRNDGDPPLANNTIVTVNLPAGLISDEGLGQIARALRTRSRRNEMPLEDMPVEEQSLAQALWAVSFDFNVKLGSKWQTKDGNYTKRLSRLVYTEHGVKLPPDLMSQIGNIASAHSRAVDVKVEVTRDLNGSPEDFAHEDSCWWGGEFQSRCALKSNGGFALRTFEERATEGGPTWASVTGRAWVMPLKVDGQGHLVPTFETLDPAAFVVFNGYEELAGYAPARIMAHLAGMTYRKVAFSCSPMWVNADSGYLVAPEDLAEKYTDGSLSLSVPEHADLYDNEKEEEMAHA